MDATPKIDTLVLDAAPLLSLSPLRGLAKNFVTIPQVIGELKDQRAREHFEQLGLAEGVNVEVRNPDASSVAAVSAAAKKSGDFAVLSRTDLLLLSLTYSLHMEMEPSISVPSTFTSANVEEPTPVPEFLEGSSQAENQDSDSESSEDSNNDEDDSQTALESETMPEDELEEHQAPEHVQSPEDVSPPDISRLTITDLPESSSQPPPSEHPPSAPVFEDPPSEDDGEGEWITPDNVALHKAREVFTTPDVSGRKGTKTVEQPLNVACMTADYAMQNVLLHMGLNLVGLQGKKITTVKSWVLRCHACFKLCKDQTKKFCPSCGNPTLIRASVSTKAAPPGSGGEAIVQVHLKNNFQYRNRGSIYSIPSPKPGNAKGSKNIILREDQIEFQRGLKNEEVRIRKEEKRIASALAAGNGGGKAGKSWADPDWTPDMLLGQTSRKGSVLPEVGYGKRNPNAVKRKKK